MSLEKRESKYYTSQYWHKPYHFSSKIVRHWSRNVEKCNVLAIQCSKMPTTEVLFRCQGGYLRLFHGGPWVSISEIQEQWFIGKLSGDLNTQGDRFIQGLYVKVWLCHVLGLDGWGVGRKASESPPKLSTSIGLCLELVYRLDAAEHFTARINLLSPTSPGLLEFGIVSLILLSMLLELNS